jgi:PAS domain S-box-containing protein
MAERDMSRDPYEALPFLRGAGAMSELVARFDWYKTALGPLSEWPAHMRTATSLMLGSQVPMVMLWGANGVMVYNEAYAVFAGDRHPQLLGSRVRDGWPEVAEFNAHVMRVCMAGGTLRYREQELMLHRHGRTEPVWLDLDYSPLMDEAGHPAGVMAIVVDTTAKVLAERALMEERESLKRLFEQAPSFMAMVQGPEHRIVMANPNYMQLIGHRPVLGLTLAQALPDVVAQGYGALLDDVWRTGEAYHATGSRYAMQAVPGGPVRERYVDFVFQPIRDGTNAVSGIFVEGVDVTARTLSLMRSDALIALTDTLRALDDTVDIAYTAARCVGEALGASRVGYGSIVKGADTLQIVRDWTAPGVASLAGVQRLREFGSFIEGLRRGELACIADTRDDARTASVADTLQTLSIRSLANVPVLEHGQLVAVFYVHHADVREWASVDLSFIRAVADRTRSATGRVLSQAAVRESEARLREVNESLEAKVQARTRELMELEATLRQSQKTEAIGQLTGGLAHDFNNLLGSMGSSLQILEGRLLIGKTENAARYIGMAQDAVRRAASLTQRLLAFSRRQTLDPRPLDVNRLIAGFEEIVRRTMGPSVQVEVVGAGGLWLTLVDGPQLENAVLNLCINARDAMAPDGGKLTIETANRWLDARTAQERDLPPGQYISVYVSDTGCGMTPDVAERIFDPFFTTKPMGQGTGLGLSMVYGFVRQSGGQVRVYSEPGRGTSMCLYLPRYLGAAPDDAVPDQAALDASAVAALDRPEGDVVLVVEDEAAIRTLVAEVLEESGYRVLTAADGPAALKLLQSDARIDLLLSDVGLPGGLNGRQVADAARVSRPDLKVLFVTGYAENAAIGNGLLSHGMQVITKPFDINALVLKVRDMIEA